MTNSESNPGPMAPGGSMLLHQLSVHPFLRGMDPQHIDKIAEYSELVRFASGDMIFRAGEPADRFYLVRTGLVSLEVAVDEHHPRTIQMLKEGDVLGWSWRFEPYQWHFDARAQTPVQTISIDAPRLRSMCEEDPAIGYAIMLRIAAVMADRLQATRLQVADLTRPS